MTSTQKAIVITEFQTDTKSCNDNLKLQEVPKPTAAEGEILLKVLLRPINPIDHVVLKGQYAKFKIEGNSMAVPGFEAVAVVTEDSKNFKKGQRVIVKHWPGIDKASGTWQEFVPVSEDRIVAVPDELSDEQAASFWVNPMTAVGLLRRLEAPKGEWIIQTAAASVLGRMIISICKHKGIKTINVVRRSEQRQELLDLGADIVIATDKEEIESTVHKITDGKGVWGGLDAVSGETTGRLVASVRSGGRVILYGLLSGLTLSASAHLILFGQREIVGFTMALWFYGNSKEVQDECVKEVSDLLVKEIIETPVRGTFPLRDIRTALSESLEPGLGKVFLSS